MKKKPASALVALAAKEASRRGWTQGTTQPEFTNEELQAYLGTYFGIEMKIDFVSTPIDACSFNDYVVAGYTPSRERKVLLISVSKTPNASWYAHPIFRDVSECNNLTPIK